MAVIATAGRVDATRFNPSIEILNSWGLNVIVSDNVLKASGYFAGTDNERSEALQSALDDPGIKAIFCARGGYGTTRILDDIVYSRFRESPKMLIGFSDVTALHLKVSSLGLTSIHGPMPIQFGSTNHLESVELLRKLLFEGRYSYDLSGSSYHNGTLRDSTILTGGNLAMVCDSLGTGTEIDTEGKVLFLEEIGEDIYRVDRMLKQLERAGKFKVLKALLIGHFTDIRDTDTSFGISLESMILEKVPSEIPVVFGLPFGHESPNYPIMINATHQITIGETVSLTFEMGE